MFKFLRVFAVLLLAGATVSFAQQDTSRLGLAREYMIARGVANAFAPMISQVMTPLRNLVKERVSIPDAVLDELFNKITAEMEKDQQTLLDQIAGVVANEFSEKEIMELIAWARNMAVFPDFQRTPVGQKLGQFSPTLVRRSTEPGTAWGERIGRQAGERLEQELIKRGYKL